MNHSRWTSLASFAAIVVAGFTTLGACAGTTESSTDSTQTALSTTDTTTTDADASTTTETTASDAGKSCEGKGEKD